MAAIKAGESDIAIHASIATWLLVAALCWAPLGFALAARLRRLLATPTLEEQWKARTAAAFSFCMGTSWWFAPALFDTRI